MTAKDESGYYGLERPETIDQQARLDRQQSNVSNNFDDEILHAAVAENNPQNQANQIMGDDMTENAEDDGRPQVKFPPLLNNQPGMAAMSRTI